MVSRRAFLSLVAGSMSASRFALAPQEACKVALYANVVSDLTHSRWHGYCNTPPRSCSSQALPPWRTCARRRAAIDEIFTEDGVFYDPSKGVYRGRDEIDRVAGAIRATHPDFRYQPIAGPEELGNGGRIQWVSGRPGEAPAYAGTDFIIARDGRIAAVYLFFDKLPAALR